jgi:hypothetical protein
MEIFTINGNYHNRPTDVFVSKTKESVKSVTIFVNGLYGVFDPTEKTDKLNILIKKLVEGDITNCVSYNSSRDFEFDSTLEYRERIDAFKDKTFLQELEDLKDVVGWVTGNCEKIFGIKREELVLNIHGNSLGGTLAILLCDFFPSIKKISLCGSGCGTNGSTKSIMSTIIDEEDILKSVGLFEGDLLLLQGGEDTTVPQESGLKILNYAIKANKIHIVVPGVNHNFSKIWGIENDEVKEMFVAVIFDFLTK